MRTNEHKFGNASNPRKEEQYLNEKLKIEDLRLFFYRKILMPTLQLQLNMEEVADEEHDYTHATALAVINALPSDSGSHIDAFAHFTGLARTSVEEKFKELFALGYIEGLGDDRFQLKTLGQRALELGKPIKRVRRSLRFCAITEQLLPAQAYDRPFKATDGLTNDDLSFVIVAEEKQHVQLHTLNNIIHYDGKQKTALNIPDEVQEIVSLEGYKSGFQVGQLVLAGHDKPQRAWVQYGDAWVEYPLHKIPFPGRRFGRAQRNAITTLANALASDGVVIDKEAVEDDYGVLTVKVIKAQDRWFGQRTMSFLPNILRCSQLQDPRSATAFMHGLPFYRYPLSSRDMLEGRCLVLDISGLGEDIALAAKLIRKFYEVRNGYYKIPRSEYIVRTVNEYLLHKITGSERTQLLQYAKRFGLEDIAKSLKTNKESLESV